MAISINWATKVITVPQADLTSLGGADYVLDVDTFRLALKNIEDSEDGMAYPYTHEHVPPKVLGGVSFARVVEIVNGYTVTFQDVGSPYRVTLTGGNNNIADVTNINNVSVRPTNSAGLVNVGSGLSPTQAVQLELVLALLESDERYEAGRLKKYRKGTPDEIYDKVVTGGNFVGVVEVTEP